MRAVTFPLAVLAFAAAVVAAVVLLPPLLGLMWAGVIALAMVVLVGVAVTAFGDSLSRRRGWAQLVHELGAGRSPIHAWVDDFPAALFEDVLTLHPPKRLTRRSWSVGHVAESPLIVVPGDAHQDAFRVSIAGEVLPWSEAKRALAKRVADAKLRRPLSDPIGDPSALRSWMAPIHPCLPAPVTLPERLDDMMTLYRAFAPYLPTSQQPGEEDYQPTRLANAVGHADFEERLRAYLEAVDQLSPDSDIAFMTLPEGAEKWRSVTRFDAADFIVERDGYWEAHDPPELFTTMIFNDGRRTIEVLLHPNEGYEIRADYPTPEALVAEGVMRRAADIVEQRLSAGHGWGKSPGGELDVSGSAER